jgi:CDP-diacylglycerol--glycerol-3-phosphate 3-phosphatidyltransferase
MITQWAREVTRPFVEPLALAVGRAGLSPNAITVIGAVAHVAVFWLLATGRLLEGAIALALAAAFDGLDGALARATDRATESGAFLDSVLDRVSEILTFGGLLYLAIARQNTGLALLVFAAVAGSLMVSYTRARSEGIGHGTKAGVFGRLERMAILVVGLATGWLVPALVLIAAGAWLTATQRVLDVLGRAGASQPD